MTENESRNIDTMLEMIANEARHPLKKVISSAELIKSKPDDTSLVSRNIGLIEDHVRSLDSMIESITIYLKRKSTETLENKHPSVIDDLVKEALEACSNLIIEKKIEAKINNNCNSPIHCQPEIISEAIANTLVYLIKITPNNSEIQLNIEHIEDKISITLKREGDTSDIHGNRYQSLYEIAERNKEKGHAIGLFIADRFVRLHKGSIEARSNESDSSIEIRITIPIHNSYTEINSKSK